MSTPPLEGEQHRRIRALSPSRLVLGCSASERVPDIFRGGVGVVVHRGIPESCPELFPSGPSVLVQHFYTLRHLGQNRGTGQTIVDASHTPKYQYSA